MKRTTKHALTHALLTGGPLPALGLVITNAVAREDGSNHSYNVTGCDHTGKTVTVYARTID